jgi:radical SAM superfamily enzyme YgiQ (UPF0313 family)
VSKHSPRALSAQPGAGLCCKLTAARWSENRQKEAHMQVYYFSEFPYHEYPDEEGAKYPSLRLTFPNTFYDPHKAHGMFHRY